MHLTLRLLTIILASMILAALALPARAQSSCLPAAVFLEALGRNGSSQLWRGTHANGDQLALFTSPNTTWHLFVQPARAPDVLCLVANGGPPQNTVEDDRSPRSP